MQREDITPKDRIVLPLDVSDLETAQSLVNHLAPHVGMFKVGLELIYSTITSMLDNDYEKAKAVFHDMRVLANSIGAGRAFMDVKFADIPNTVGKASLAVSRMGAAWFNVHASAGLEAIKAAVANCGSSKVLGVTVLTSIEMSECISIFGKEPKWKVLQFAAKIQDAGAYGIICSPEELKILRATSEFNQLRIVTPGVRPKGSAVNDQKRIMTPGEAIAAGADYLVIGRPITGASDPVAAAKNIAEEIGLAENVCRCGHS